MANKIKDLSGIRVGMLVASGISGTDESGRKLWRMVCDCGGSVERTSAYVQRALQRDAVSHCGCSPALKTHGLSMSHKKLQWIWKAMRQRCGNPSNKDYQNYGGRGIALCDEWSEFSVFAAWAITSGYTEGLTIERNDVNLGYSAGNCCWVDNRLQGRNTTKTKRYTHNGTTLDIRGWSELSGVPYFRLRSRLINYKWPIERAIAA